MKEDFVAYELAVKLKEKGYPQRNVGNYGLVGSCYFKDGKFYEAGCIALVEDCFTAPMIHEALKWLREEKHIAINITFIAVCWQFTALPMSFNKNRFKLSGKTYYLSYEQAALAGIEYVLDNLI